MAHLHAVASGFEAGQRVTPNHYLLGHKHSARTQLLMNQTLFILGDGDRIRARVEGYLLNARLTELSRYSDALTQAIEAAASKAKEVLLAERIMAGGDDLLLRIEAHAYDKGKIQEIADLFKKICNSTISFGVGTTIDEAFLALRKAKSQGGDTVVEDGLRRE